MNVVERVIATCAEWESFQKYPAKSTRCSTCWFAQDLMHKRFCNAAPDRGAWGGEFKGSIRANPYELVHLHNCAISQ